MNWWEFFKHLFVPKLVLKTHMLAFVVFVASLLRYSPDWSGVLGFFLFFLTYLSTYFYNDIVDARDDEKKAVYPAKLLARGWATQSEYLFLAANLFATGVLITTFYNPVLGAAAFLAVFLNNIRSHIREVFPRQVFLALVEYLNFVAAWISLYGGFPGILESAVLMEYCLLYALGHIVYKVRNPLKSTLQRVDSAAIAFFVALLALPTFYVISRHWAGLVFGIGGALLYAIPQQIRVGRGNLHDQTFVDRIFWQHSALMGIVGLWFLAGALIISF